MNLLNFIEQFPDEDSCRSHLKQIRKKQGVICKKCKGKNHYWLKAKQQWQCTQCDFRTTLRNSTMMENRKLPLRTWYIAMAFELQQKKHFGSRDATTVGTLPLWHRLVVDTGYVRPWAIVKVFIGWKEWSSSMKAISRPQLKKKIKRASKGGVEARYSRTWG